MRLGTLSYEARAAATAVSLALIVLVVGACGTRSPKPTPHTTTQESGKPSPPELTAGAPRHLSADRARFVMSADATCARYQGRLRRLNDRFRSERRADTAAKLLDRGASTYAQVIARLAALRPPAGDQPTIRAYLDANRETMVGLRGAAAAYRARDSVLAAHRLAEVSLASARGRAIAQTYGFLVCGTTRIVS